MAKCKFYKEIQYYSDDMGQTWFPTGLSRKGELIETESTDCDEPTPPTFDGKYLFTYKDYSIESAACDSSSAITSADTIGQNIPYSSLTSVEIGDCVSSIGESTFQFYELTDVTMGNNVTSIGAGAFNFCESLTSITLSNNLETIGNRAFTDCISLTSVELPNSVTAIDYIAFADCSNLTSITIYAQTPPTLGEGAFDNTNNCQIYVPSASVDAYKTAYSWSNYVDRIQALPNS